ncbi:hypothetical protein SAMN05421812_115177 [Asanoa hainanensis]|uniref:Uncharacterized protein n=1 Tax=Asanoa hainanensis TaxID=560556 RepID=A0A239PAS1_9ACTN|nr:hypothetical protein [Asanoa hainanensis]SNT63658.1 hypothetical protein SAMN05421812_115177 [Asanoa hainanensis]
MESAEPSKPSAAEPGPVSEKDVSTATSDTPVRRHRLIGDAVLFPAVMSVVGSLLGALVGGLVTAYATQATVRAQVDSARVQADSDRALQMRDQRGASYGEFLNGLADAEARLDEFYACSTPRVHDWTFFSRSPERGGPGSSVVFARGGPERRTAGGALSAGLVPAFPEGGAEDMPRAGGGPSVDVQRDVSAQRGGDPAYRE